MFFTVNLLQVKKHFSLLWIAATEPTKLQKKRRECLRFNIVGACDEILECLPSTAQSGGIGHTKESYSLRLCAQLMAGIVRVHAHKVAAVYGEAQKLQVDVNRPKTVAKKRLELAKPTADLNDINLPVPNPLDIDLNDSLMMGLRTAPTMMLEMSSFDQLDFNVPAKFQAREEDITMREHMPAHAHDLEQLLNIEDLPQYTQQDLDLLARQDEQARSQGIDATVDMHLRELREMELALGDETREQPTIGAATMADLTTTALVGEQQQQAQPDEQRAPGDEMPLVAPEQQEQPVPVYAVEEQQQQQPGVAEAVPSFELEDIGETARQQTNRRRSIKTAGRQQRTRGAGIVDAYIQMDPAIIKDWLSDTSDIVLSDEAAEAHLFMGAHRVTATSVAEPFDWVRPETKLDVTLWTPFTRMHPNIRQLVFEHTEMPAPIERDNVNDFINLSFGGMLRELKDSQEKGLETPERRPLAPVQEHQLIDDQLQLDMQQQPVLDQEQPVHEQQQQPVEEIMNGTVGRSHERINGNKRTSAVAGMEEGEDVENAGAARKTRSKRNKRTKDASKLDDSAADASVEKARQSLADRSASLAPRGRASSILDPMANISEEQQQQQTTALESPSRQQQMALEPIDETRESGLTAQHVANNMNAAASQSQTAIPRRCDLQRKDVLVSIAERTDRFDGFTFAQLCPTNTTNRVMAAKTFEVVLALAKRQMVRVEQDGDSNGAPESILIKLNPNHDGLQQILQSQ